MKKRVLMLCLGLATALLLCGCARTINELLLKLSDTPPEQLLEEFLGHTPLQVACGALLGAAVATLYSLP